MAAKLIGMLQLRRILQLLDNGSKIRSIARDLGISRNTVKAYLPAIARSKLAIAELLALNDEALSALIHEPERGSLTGDTRYQDFQHCLAVIEEELKKTGVTRQLLWQEYRMVHPDGYGYTQFCYHLQEHFKHKDTVMHFVHNPAEKMLIDFAGKTIRYTDEEGKEIKCQVFIAILPYSGYTYVEAVHSQKQDDFVRCLENALIFFGGVPGCIISDNLKSCIKRADRYEPQLTDLLDQFSLYYNTTVSATRVAKPRDKASVEKAVNLTYQRIYAPIRNKAFRCLEDLNAAIREQTKEHHSRRFRQSQESRQYLFETEEKSGLRPLPSSRMQISNTVTAKVQGNYHIVLGQDWHYYSVPYQYTGKEVKVVYTHASVEIYLEHKRIAVHRRNVRRNGYTTIGEHMPENHRH
jgi:transposase